MGNSLCVGGGNPNIPCPGWRVDGIFQLYSCSWLEMFGVYKLDGMGTLEDSSNSGKANKMQTICQHESFGNGCLKFCTEKAKLRLVGKGAVVDRWYCPWVPAWETVACVPHTHHPCSLSPSPLTGRPQCLEFEVTHLILQKADEVGSTDDGAEAKKEGKWWSVVGVAGSELRGRSASPGGTPTYQGCLLRSLLCC